MTRCEPQDPVEHSKRPFRDQPGNGRSFIDRLQHDPFIHYSLGACPSIRIYRAPCIHTRLRRLATKTGEKCGLVAVDQVAEAAKDAAFFFSGSGY
jgi:hypothetical protein